MLVGTTITEDTIKALYEDPEKTNPEKLYEYLAKEGLSRVSQSSFRDDVISSVNGLKKNYGNGISTKICILNATGQELKKLHEGSWHGRWHVGFDPSISNGQGSSILHVHSDSAAKGSSGYLVYRIQNLKLDVFIGWYTPYSGRNTFIVEIREENHWWEGGKESYMQNLVEQGWAIDIPNDQQDFSTKLETTKFTAHVEGVIDQESSPMLLFTLSMDKFEYESN